MNRLKLNQLTRCSVFGASIVRSILLPSTLRPSRIAAYNLSSCASLSSSSTSTSKVMSGDSKFKVIFVLGAPGAGKGTQCEKIESGYGFVHLSAGDLLRRERQTEGSQYGELIATHIKEGTIVPVQITCSLLKKEMESSGKENFLIDGFPRNRDNLDGWNEVMKEVSEVRNVFFFNCTDQACVDRCLKRGLTSNRTDDNEESLKKRLVTYRSSTMPIIDHFRASNLVSDIDGSGSPDEVYEQVKKVLDRLGFKAV